MKNILFIGQYFPEMSFDSLRNHLIVDKISSYDNKVILVSDSWCNVSEEGFIGNYEELSANNIFIKKYYVDPLQIRLTKMPLITALLGLTIKVINSEDIDEIFISDLSKYGIIAELIKNRFKIKIYTSINNLNFTRMTSEPYSKEIISYLIKNFDVFFTFNEDILNYILKLSSSKKYIHSIPIINNNAVYEGTNNTDMIYILNLSNKINYKEINKIINELQNKIINVVVCGIDNQQINYFKENTNINIFEINTYNEFTMLSKSSGVIIVNEVNSYIIDIEKYIILYNYNIPIIVDNETYKELNVYLNIDSISIDDKYHKIVQMVPKKNLPCFYDVLKEYFD